MTRGNDGFVNISDIGSFDRADLLLGAVEVLAHMAPGGVKGKIKSKLEKTKKKGKTRTCKRNILGIDGCDSLPATTLDKFIVHKEAERLGP